MRTFTFVGRKFHSWFWLSVLIYVFCWLFRDAPEATGDEPEDADFETPKVYELVRASILS